MCLMKNETKVSESVINEEKCVCGWELPLSILAYQNSLGSENWTYVKDVHVRLVCPRCKRGHAFFDAAGMTEISV